MDPAAQDNSKVAPLNRLKEIIEKKDFQRGIIQLYSSSQKEHSKNGRLGPEVGMSREKDLIATLKRFEGENVNYDIDNRLPEDLCFHTLKISLKHSQGDFGSTVKAKWTSADKSVEEAIKMMIEAPDEYYPALLICYIDSKKKKITYVLITAEQNKNTIKSLRAGAFKVPSGNSRGIEYSKAAMSEFMKNIYFKVEINDADLTTGIDPIERRMKVLEDKGINPS
jgi:hypothetical protein